jgi:uncharacterized protein YecT (DUF1311 family)
MNTIRLAILALVLATAACATPCQTLADIRTGVERGQPAVKALCDCISSDSTAATVCAIEAGAYTVTDATLNAAYATFCSSAPKGAPASKLQTREQLDAWLTANGATRK